MCNFDSTYPMLRLNQPPGVSLIQTTLGISCRERYIGSLWMSRWGARRNYPSAWSSMKLGGGQLAFKMSGILSNCMLYILDTSRSMLWAIDQSQFSKWVLVTIWQPIFLNGYILWMWKRHMDLLTKSIAFNRGLGPVTGVQVLTIWRRHCRNFTFKVSVILALQIVSTFNPPPIHGKIVRDPIIYTSSIVRKSHDSTPYHKGSITWEKVISAVCADASNKPHSEMH